MTRRGRLVRRALLRAALWPWPGEAAPIEARRQELLAADRDVNVRLPGQPAHVVPLPRVVRSVAKRPVWGRFLMELASRLPVRGGVELGSSVGLTTAYLAAGLRRRGEGRLVAIEGAPDVAREARETITALALDDLVDLREGRFRDELPGAVADLGTVELAFVDGHHERDATLAYLDLLRPALSARSLVVFDDIRWSPGMKAAWTEIRARGDTGFAMTVGTVGIWGPAR